MAFTRETFGGINVVEVHCNFSIGVWKGLYVAAERSHAIPAVRVQDGGRQFIVLEAKHFDELQLAAGRAGLEKDHTGWLDSSVSGNFRSGTDSEGGA